MKVYYNEIDLYAAQWLRNLIAAGHLPDGDVDDRDIRDVTPQELEPYAQCHFFAGIGVWPLALARAGFPIDYPVWSGSCPCQPFSAAGAGAGFADERHLWPHFHYLIGECRPAVVVGEQVASKDGLGWFDLVQTDLEASGYACGAVDSCAAGYGAPHIRQRLYFAGVDQRHPQRLDDAAGARHVGPIQNPEGQARYEARLRLPDAGCSSGRLADRIDERLEGFARTSPDWNKPRWVTQGPDRQSSKQIPAGRVGDSIEQSRKWISGGFSRAQTKKCGEGQQAGYQYVRPEHAGAVIFSGLADTDSGQRGGGPNLQERNLSNGENAGRTEDCSDTEQHRSSVGLADRATSGRRKECTNAGRELVGDKPEGISSRSGASNANDGLADTDVDAAGQSGAVATRKQRLHSPDGGVAGQRGEGSQSGSIAGEPAIGPARATNSFWADADWLFCRDGKWRPVGPATFPLANGITARVGRLRAYGNAIVAPQAESFCNSLKEVLDEL